MSTKLVDISTKPIFMRAKTLKNKDLTLNNYSYFPRDKQFDYQKFLFYWIARTESLYAQEMDKSLKAIGMDSSRWRIGLLLCKHEELTISTISNESVMKVPTVTKIVQRMEKEGLVTVHKQESDGRVRLVRLTSQGKFQIEMIVEQTAPLFETTFSEFSAEEMEIFLDLNKRLFDSLHHFSESTE